MVFYLNSKVKENNNADYKNLANPKSGAPCDDNNSNNRVATVREKSKNFLKSQGNFKSLILAKSGNSTFQFTANKSSAQFFNTFSS